MTRDPGGTFIDEARITAIGGDGGDGCCSFRREKFVPRGGPDGGDGGDGGAVVLVADRGVNTLFEFRYRNVFRAERGRHGQGANRSGRSGQDLVVRVPVGTIILDETGTRVVADLASHGQTVVATTGGRGGRGNARFATSIHRAPTRHERGQPGEQRAYRLELKLLADVGLVGLPNVGKSTLISSLSAARPRIADYPFTTLVPNLGVVDRGDFLSFVVADVPGLIEGAHRGAGLGHRFLRHVERCRLLLHLVDPTAAGRDPRSDIRIINRELRRHGEELGRKPQILVLTKADVLQDRSVVDDVRDYAARRGTPVLLVSAVTGEGLDLLVRVTSETLDRLDANDAVPALPREWGAGPDGERR
jgi:GTP-binding protein